MSAAFHLTNNHSHEVSRIGNKLDYVGIVFSIWGSFVPAIYYEFCGQENVQRTYWAMISILSVGCVAVSTLDKFRTSAFRPYRAGMFAALGLSGVIPVLHGLQVYGIEKLQNSMGLNWVLLQGILYILGAGLYAVSCTYS